MVNRRLLYLTPYPPARSGIADYAAHFKEALEEFTDWRPEVAVKNRLDGASLRDMAAIYRRVFRWRRESALKGVDLVHAEVGYKQHDEFYTLYWLRRLMPSVPYSITIHDPPLVIAPALYPLSLGMASGTVRRALRVADYTRVGKQIVRTVLSDAASLFVLSCAGKQALQDTTGGHLDLHVLPLLTYRSKPPQRHAFDRVDKKVRILFLGFWGPGKGIDILLQAIEHVIDGNRMPVHLVIAGGAERNRASEAYAAQIMGLIDRSPARHAIEVLGYVPEENIDRVFDQSDVFVIPTARTAGLSASSVLSRAMASGLAIVASDIGTLGEEVRHMETGLLVPSNDVTALAEAIRCLVEDAELRAELGHRAQEHIYTEHGREHVAKKAAAVFEAAATR